MLQVRVCVYAAAGKWPLALEVARTLTRVLPDEAESWFQLARCECQAQNLRTARTCLEKALDLDPSLRKLAVDDPALASFWDHIGGT